MQVDCMNGWYTNRSIPILRIEESLMMDRLTEAFYGKDGRCVYMSCLDVCLIFLYM